MIADAKIRRPPEVSMRFFVLSNGITSGPFTPQQLRKLADSGRLSLADRIRKESDSHWHAAGSVKGLFDQPLITAIRPMAVPQPEPSPILLQPATATAGPSRTHANILGIAALCLGGLAICLCWFPFLGLPLAVLGLMLGIVAVTVAYVQHGSLLVWPTSGLAVGALSVVPSLAFLVLLVTRGATATTAGQPAQNQTRPKIAEAAPVAAKPKMQAAQVTPAAVEVVSRRQPELTSLERVVSQSTPSIALIQGRTSSGTGFLIEPNVIATNKHVISDELISSLHVYFPSAPEQNRGPLSAKLLYEDELQDLAFLRVETPLQPLPIDDSYRFRQGQEILVIGNPGVGNSNMVLKNAVSKGIMSTEVTVLGRPYYQLSISINPGNSGGPVLDEQGRVVGVLTLKAAHNEGLAFCVPVGQLRASFARSRTLTPDDLALVEQQHQVRVKQQSDGSATEYTEKLHERGDIDPALRGLWRLYVTSNDGGRTTKSFNGERFATVYPMRVELEGNDTLTVSNVYICKDDEGHPANLVVFSNRTMWIVTKRPNQEYVLVQVVGVHSGKVKETFRFVVTAERPVARPVVTDLPHRRHVRSVTERDVPANGPTASDRDRQVDAAATKRYAGLLRLSEREIRSKQYSRAVPHLVKIIQKAPGTQAADDAQRLLDSVPDKYKHSLRD
jgi:S1-C subfamily serine protease